MNLSDDYKNKKFPKAELDDSRWTTNAADIIPDITISKEETNQIISGSKVTANLINIEKLGISTTMSLINEGELSYSNTPTSCYGYRIKKVDELELPAGEEDILNFISKYNVHGNKLAIIGKEDITNGD